MILKTTSRIVTTGVQVFITAEDGTAPYTYLVRAGGAGGSIDSNGVYTAPSGFSSDPKKGVDTIEVQDSLGEIATTVISVSPVIKLVGDIIKKELELNDDQVYLYKQKMEIPKTPTLFVVLSTLTEKPYSNNRKYDGSGSGLNEIQETNIRATLNIEIWSRDTSAEYRKEEIIMALGSTYSQQQQELNQFSIAKITQPFTNVNSVDGAAVPYRFNIGVIVHYTKTKSKAVPYFNTFETNEIQSEP